MPPVKYLRSFKNVTVRYKVLLLCAEHAANGNEKRIPVLHTDEASAIEIGRLLALQHRQRNCKAVVIKETVHGARSEFEHIATFHYQKLLGEEIVYSDRE